LKTGETKIVMENAGDGKYLPTGHLVYAFGATVRAVPFDLKTLQPTGGAVPVINGVLRSAGNTPTSHVSFSDTGTMTSIPSAARLAGARVLSLVDQSGGRQTLALPPGNYFHPRVSPDGKQIAFHKEDGSSVGVWTYPLDESTGEKLLTLGGSNRFPIWVGDRIVFQSDREGDLGLWWQRADGSDAATRLTRADQKTAHTPDFSFPDGRIGFTINRGDDRSLWSTSPNNGEPILLIEHLSTRPDTASISKDGHWVAYVVDRSGRPEVEVQPLPKTGAIHAITTTRGVYPTWSWDGKQLIYTSNPGGGAGDLMSVDVSSLPRFETRRATPLGVKGILHNGAPNMPRGWDVTRDGKFIVMFPTEESGQSQQIIVTLNWFEELKRLVPVK